MTSKMKIYLFPLLLLVSFFNDDTTSQPNGGPSTSSSHVPESTSVKLPPKWLQGTLKDAKITNPQLLVRGRQTRSKASTSTHAEVNFALMQSIISSPTEPTSAEEAIQIPHYGRRNVFHRQERHLGFGRQTPISKSHWCQVGVQNQISFRREH